MSQPLISEHRIDDEIINYARLPSYFKFTIRSL